MPRNVLQNTNIDQTGLEQQGLSRVKHFLEVELYVWTPA
jgi:hypothetical protein